MPTEQKSRFYVVEGLDGSGKSTQIQLLLEHMKSKGLSCSYLHFPRTDQSIYGDLIARYLRGDLGPVETVHPYLAALIFAGDRHEAAGMIREWLAKGQIVITDRYVISNIAFQCAKMRDEKEKKLLKEWILRLEYEHHRIPRPDMSIFLDVPFRFTQQKLSNNRHGEDREYLRGNQDIHEQDLDLQKRVRQVYQELVKEDNTVRIVDCSGGEGEMLAPEIIFEKIQNLI